MSKLEFPGGDVDVRTPKPDELLLSAKQWVTLALESLQDGGDRSLPAAKRALGYALTALAELKGHV